MWKSFQGKVLIHEAQKKEHIESVPLCRDASYGTCHFGNMKCWFNHEDVENLNENGNNVNQEVVDKIFDMMENFTQRILEIENNLWINNDKSRYRIIDNWIIPEHKFKTKIK